MPKNYLDIAASPPSRIDAKVTTCNTPQSLPVNKPVCNNSVAPSNVHRHCTPQQNAVKLSKVILHDTAENVQSFDSDLGVIDESLIRTGVGTRLPSETKGSATQLSHADKREGPSGYVLRTTAVQPTAFMPDGTLNPALAVVTDVNSEELIALKPQQRLAGDLYYKDNKYFIKNNAHLYEVYYDPSADSIRLRCPQYPVSQDPRIIFRDGRWQPHHVGLKGGGPVLSFFYRRDEQPDKDFILMITAIGQQDPDIETKAKECANILSNQEKMYIVNELRQELEIESLDDFRKIFSDLKKGALKVDLDGVKAIRKSCSSVGKRIQIWQFVSQIRTEILKEFPDMPFEHEQSVKIYHLLSQWLKNNNKPEIAIEFIVFSDPYTQSKKIIFCLKEKKKALEGIRSKFEEYMDEALKFVTNKYLEKAGLPTLIEEGAEVEKNIASVFNWIDQESLGDEFYHDYRAGLKEILKNNKFNLHNEIKKHNFVDIVIFREKITRPAIVVNESEISAFEEALPKLSSELEIENTVKVQTHKMEKRETKPLSRKTHIADSMSGPLTKQYVVKLGPVAKCQMELDEFPEAARLKVDEIMNDIAAGRVSRKKIGDFVYVDLTQLGNGGRGPWRAAFKREGGTFTLVGFVDYHNNKNIAWGLRKMAINW